MNWHNRLLDLARHVSTWSKDPSTKVGAVIADSQHRIISIGYNGFARGVIDSSERLHNRDVKLQLILHAEENALHNASRGVCGASIYIWPMEPCSLCAARIIQAGITDVYAPDPDLDRPTQWRESFALAAQQYAEAGVRLHYL